MFGTFFKVFGLLGQRNALMIAHHIALINLSFCSFMEIIVAIIAELGIIVVAIDMSLFLARLTSHIL